MPADYAKTTFVAFSHWKADDKLVPAGLIGPVVLRPAAVVPLTLQAAAVGNEGRVIALATSKDLKQEDQKMKDTMKSYLCGPSLFSLSIAFGGSAAPADPLETSFRHPPDSARPWVYWFPLNGNLTKEGITADLEAMERVGIGGVLYMEVDQKAPG